MAESAFKRYHFDLFVYFLPAIHPSHPGIKSVRIL
jgi:hypothetical protein